LNRSPFYKLAAILLPALLLAGCVRRTLSIQSNPSGALVHLNGREAGRTPMTIDFTWYGDYDVQVRKEGYETLKTHEYLVAPIWQWVPFDFIFVILPIPMHDDRHLTYTLAPSTQPSDPAGLLDRASQLQSHLEGPDQSP
jgi:hypothetical protein